MPNFIVDTLYFVEKNYNYNNIDLLDHYDFDYIKTRYFPYEITWSKGGGMYGYSCSLYCNGLRILYNKCDNNNLYFILSGRGCRLLEDLHKLKFNEDFNWYKYFDRLKGCQIRRIDLACDVVESFNKSVPYLIRLYESNRVASRFSNVRYIQGSEECIYFGSPQSNSMLRIYNKNLERGFKSDELLDQFPYGRTRWEWQFRDFEAQRCFHRLMLNGIYSTFCYYTNKNVRFLSRSKDFDNVSRIPNCSWYDKLFSNRHLKYDILSPGSSYNKEKLIRYIQQCKSSVLTFYKSEKLDPDSLVDFISKAKIRPDQQLFIDNNTKL